MSALRRSILPALLALAAACGSTATKPPSQLPPVGDLMAWVDQPDGTPVGAAVFDGTGAFTDRNGVATGVLAPNAAGWTRLSAGGFVTVWTKPLPWTFEGKKLVLATLTPVQVRDDVDALEQQVVVLGPPARPDAVLRIPFLGFMEPVTLSFTLMRAQDVGAMAFAPQSGGGTLHLQRAFSLEAISEDQQMQPTTPIELDLRHPARFGAPTLGTFDPDAGDWVMDGAACRRLDADFVRCAFAHFSVQGIFGDAFPESTGNAWLDERARMLNGEPEDIEETAQAALEYADRNPSEAGKSALMATAAAATAARRPDLVQTLVDRGKEIVEDLIDMEIHEEGCGRITEMLHLETQGTLLAVSPTLLQLLRDRIDQAKSGCDLWNGSVNYFYRLQPTMPELEDVLYVEGDRNWSERHLVYFRRDAEGHFDGESFADVKFPLVIYRDDVDDQPECGDDFIANEAEGVPPRGRVRVSFSGVIQEGTWLVTSVSSEPVVRMRLQTRFHAHKWAMVDDACTLGVDEDHLLPWVDSYTTQLDQGFLGPTPPSLAEMLTEGHRGTNPIGLHEPGIRGSDTVTIEAQPGVWPFEEAWLDWFFFQVVAPQ